MTTSRSNPGPATRFTEARERIERLSGFSPDQLTDAMTWLAGHDGEAFDAALDAIEAYTSGGAEEPEPVCGACGSDIGVFLKFGLDWRHYRGDTLGESEIFDPGHAPEPTWRLPSQRMDAV